MPCGSPATRPEAIARLVTENGGSVVRGGDPITPMKAVKNAVEIEGARAAQLRDGVAVTRFLAWFERAAARGDLTEIAAVEALESFRRETGLLKDISFPTIAGAGPNGAIVHYRVTRKTNRRISSSDLFLLDFGGQYEDGTTDITRTIAVGVPSAEMRRNFTLVLKGHIAIARAVFPDGTTGAQLDLFARQFLWRAGLDFDHGTGHGVGSYLSVHEGPARIAKLGSAPLKRGMILSNEPGYYRTGAYGIRIENSGFGDGGAGGARRRKTAQCLRDADARADRCTADRCEPADFRRARLVRRLSVARARNAGAAPRYDGASMVVRRDDTAAAQLENRPEWNWRNRDARISRASAAAMQHQIKSGMAGTGSADATLFACSQTRDQLFVPPWARFRSARFLFQRRDFFLYGAPVMPTELLHRGWRCPTGLDRSEEPMLGTILIILLILLLVGALPTWPYSTGWGYYPGGGIGLILIIVLVLVLVGRI